MIENPQVPLPLLSNFKRWVLADETGKPIPGTAVADEQHWRSFDAAYEKFQQGACQNIGVALTGRAQINGKTLIVIDLDCAFDEGKLTPWAKLALEAIGPSYTEVSPSGNGLHVFVLSDEPNWSDSKRYIDAPKVNGKKPQIQFFGGVDGANYVRVTGDIYGESPATIEEADLTKLDLMFPTQAKTKAAEKVSEKWTAGESLSHEELTRRVVAQFSQTHVDGAHWPDSYPSPSEAYFALVRAALKASGGDGQLVVEWLLDPNCTGAWALGCVEGSADPGKYGKREWVENRVKKATGEQAPFQPDAWSQDEAQGSAALQELPEEEDEEDTALFMKPRAFRQVFSSPAPFLVENLVPARGVVQIYGRPGQGKSCWAMALAYAVASGADSFFGHDVMEHGPVVILVGEDPHGVANRTAAQEILCEIEDEQDVYLSRTPVPLTAEPEVLAPMAQLVGRVRPKLIIVDTQIANAGDISENDTDDMKKLMERCESLAQTASCTVLLVHHTDKAGKGARGSSVQTGAVVADYRAVRDGAGEGAVYRLEPGKAKNWAAGRPIRASMSSVTVGELKNGNPHTAPALDYRGGNGWEQDASDEPEPDFGDLQNDLLGITAVHGPVTRTRVVELLNEQGYDLTVQQLRKREKSLEDKGLQGFEIVVARGRAGGVAYHIN